MKMVTLTENEVFLTFFAVALLLLGAYVCGKLMEWIKAPKVIGEILGGMIFSGTFLAHYFPDLVFSVFAGYAEESKVLNMFYQMGLVFLMFSSGFNTKLEFEKEKSKTIICLLVGATVVPMAAALPFAHVFREYFNGNCVSDIPYVLVFIIGVAITSIPVISKIFFDLGIMNTEFSNVVLTVSTFQDLCLWIMLNVATRIATTGDVKLIDMIITVVLTLGMFILARFVAARMHGYDRIPKATDFYTICVISLFIVAAVLTKTGINIMYSAFLVGYIVKAVSESDSKAKERMQSLADFSFSLFVPVYFALVGIQLNLRHNFSVFRFLAFFVLAFALEAAGTLIMLRFTDLKKNAMINFAITMNARGGPGIVLATVAYSYAIISEEFFTTLILTTMLSSMIAGYWLRRQQKKDETIFTVMEKGK